MQTAGDCAWKYPGVGTRVPAFHLGLGKRLDVISKFLGAELSFLFAPLYVLPKKPKLKDSKAAVEHMQQVQPL